MKATPFFIALTLFFSAVFVHAEDKPGLGLAERRAIKEYQEKVYPDLLKEIQTAAAFEVPVEVKWEKIAIAGEAPKFSDPGFWTDIYFKPLAGAFTAIAADDMGKTALKEKLKQVVITFEDGAPASNYKEGVNFADGTLTINFRPYSNAQDVKQRTEAIQAKVEPKL